MKVFNPSLTIDEDNYREYLLEVVNITKGIKSPERDVITLSCITANLLEAYYDNNNFVVMPNNRDYYDGLFDEVELYWCKYELVINVLEALIKLKYATKAGDLYWMGESNPILSIIEESEKCPVYCIFGDENE